MADSNDSTETAVADTDEYVRVGNEVHIQHADGSLTFAWEMGRPW